MEELVAEQRLHELHRQLEENRLELERLNRAFLETTRTDPLTGLGNRARLLEDFQIAATLSARYRRAFALALLDIDEFDAYQHRLGLSPSHEALRAIATMISTCSRGGDSVYRVDSDKFVVLMPDCRSRGAVGAVNKIRAAIQSLAVPHPGSAAGVITLSAGIAALTPGEECVADELLSRAATALARAKQAGGNRVVAYQPDGATATGRRSTIPAIS